MIHPRPYLPGRYSVALLFSLFVGISQTSYAADPAAEGLEFFEKKIRPILVQHCSECHSTVGKKRGGLLLDSREGWLVGGDSGPAIVPGDPEKSLLILAVRQTDKDLRMPPKQKLTDMQIADLETWVKNGAVDPRQAIVGKPEELNARTKPKYGMTLEAGRQFWSFQPVQNPVVPVVKNAIWARNDIDNFILSRMEQAGVTPAPTADPRTLLRRVTFDLTGLPPTPAEMDAFLADAAPNAFERVIDRLLDSPRYGERWGRHWLDVVRYADTSGNASDYPVPQAHRYRDWVIRAFNRDLAYDQFLREQIAGDLIPGGTDAERFERITATGYLAIARRFGGDRKGEHHLTLEDTIDNLGRATLGLSISCARCHDHKFDPLTMSDYYGLYGIFESTRYPYPGAEADKKQADFVPLATPAEIEALLAPHREKLAVI
ncbi:MAG: Planctomycete cytochrome, partial [Planctomycetaceae bacterium]|nr:Planctomycete cytochrome [Planctomycetaceae bacterium]